MLKATTIAVAVTLMVAPASAQVIDLGRGGPQIDLRSNAQRDRDFLREQMRRDMAPSRYDRRDLSTGSVRRGCREVTIRERDDDGRMVTRTRRDC